MDRQEVTMAAYEHGLERTLEKLDKNKIMSRIWAKDPAVWKDESSHQQLISTRLGWLDVVFSSDKFYEPLRQLQKDARNFSHVLLLGMGGSSLGAEVMRQTWGVMPGYPDLKVLDTTDPQAISLATQAIDLDRTLFIVSTKSGGTVETTSLYKYYWNMVSERHGTKAGEQFCAITDAGSDLDKMARENKFKYLFLNPEDIGGRYSVLSYFGLVPAVLMGLDLDKFLDSARRMATACGANIPIFCNPAAWLGAVMGHLAEMGCDKVCLVSSPKINTFGLWVEQLVAESTGKEGKGIVPVASVYPDDPRNYDDDQLLVYLRLDGLETELDRQMEAMVLAGHPVMTLHLQDEYDLAGEFFRWELATAVSGHMMQINPFDQPNVGESKENTKRLLNYIREHGELPKADLVLEEGGIRLYADDKTVDTLRRIGEQRRFEHGDLINLLLAHISLAHSGDYLALMAYLAPTEKHDQLLQAICDELRHATTRAVTLGYGPRFLHSTGQLHKGGANNGVFIQITVDNNEKLPIPGDPYDFMLLKRAQAQGDLEALQSKDRRVVRFHLPMGTVSAGLESLLEAIRTAAAKKRGW
jgi:glucose-6-phosphate isomerase